jgi:DNA-binding PadR family transcriptional regulator
MAQRRKVNNLLALAVLALAAEAPMHPYEMATKLRERGKDQSIKINWGSLYTVVGNLEKHGLIQATETEREGRRPERTLYAITEAGMAELKDWMRELLGSYEKEYRRLEAALAELPILPPDEVADLLAEREDAIRAEIARLADLCQRAGADLPRLFLLETEYELALLRAEADWIAALRAELADGSFPGLAFWRYFHDSGLPPSKVVEMFERGELPT